MTSPGSCRLLCHSRDTASNQGSNTSYSASGNESKMLLFAEFLVCSSCRVAFTSIMRSFMVFRSFQHREVGCVPVCLCSSLFPEFAASLAVDALAQFFSIKNLNLLSPQL